LGTDYQFVDGEFMGEYSLSTKVWALGSSNDEQENAEFKLAYGADTLFSSRELTLAAAYSEVSDHFNPPLGYVERDDYRKYYLFSSYEPRYEDLDWLMASFHQYELELYTDTGNSLSDVTHTFTPFTLIFGTGDSVSYEITRKSDRPDEAFTIFDTSLQAGKYDGTYHTISLDTDSKRKINGSLGYTWSDLYASGKRYEASVDFLMKKELMFGLGYSNTSIKWNHAPETELRVVNATSRINFNPDLSINNLLQYDNFSKSLGVNSRLQWEYKPGAKFYFVVNQSYLDEATGFSLQGYGTAVKLGGIFRF
jgi:hypothetical protein